MNLFGDIELPFVPVISFEAVIRDLENKSSLNPTDESLRKLLEKINEIPELRTGFEDISFIENNKPLVKELLSDLFPAMLTKNEIKAATIPMSNYIFNRTERFRNILKESGKEFGMADIRF